MKQPLTAYLVLRVGYTVPPGILNDTGIVIQWNIQVVQIDFILFYDIPDKVSHKIVHDWSAILKVWLLYVRLYAYLECP